MVASFSVTSRKYNRFVSKTGKVFVSSTFQSSLRYLHIFTLNYMVIISQLFTLKSFTNMNFNYINNLCVREYGSLLNHDLKKNYFMW